MTTKHSPPAAKPARDAYRAACALAFWRATLLEGGGASLSGFHP